MFDLCGWIDATRFQSIFQLGTAVALAFIVAGPAVRTILAQQITGFEGLRKTLVELANLDGEEDIVRRVGLVKTMEDILHKGQLETVRVNSHTNIWYVAAAAASFLLLLVSSIYSQIPVLVGWGGIVIVLLILFIDPIRIACESPSISRLIDLVDYIARTIEPSDPSGAKVKKATLVIGYLALRKISLEIALRQLEEIKLRDFSMTRHDDSPQA
ncbi:hypothetical protein ELI00_29125 (plasmid) [Rhizobium ruizarguesonis]|uniref:hypothetical protein n=1 Tax=Rhizobium ruizarguesonis TaxID=2081791 RepID=UPI0010317AE7|nr:hypothetical protein [Rhizobium ruizarguesonis]NEK04267.1 hypothetical protein [Rhizobium ruizarguesonis]TAX66739.1 hypothetical protein ELI00_29125 [Rhizobium ruizarguesonis]